MNDCCNDMENRGPVERVSDDLSLTRGLTCGARHFELVLDEADLVSEVEDL